MKKFKNRLKFFQFPKTPSLPSSYILPKDKDIKRFRPIVPYFNYTYKNLFKCAARGLFHLLKHSQKQHFTIFNTMNTMDFIKTQKLENYESHLLIKGDIKEMYSNLPHEEIKKAIDWVIACYQITIKEENISIKLRGKIETTTGKFKGKISGQFKQLSIKEIREITMYDLENTYLRVGTFVLQQCKNIPMESPLSPMLAILYCARIESYF